MKVVDVSKFFLGMSGMSLSAIPFSIMTQSVPMMVANLGAVGIGLGGVVLSKAFNANSGGIIGDKSGAMLVAATVGLTGAIDDSDKMMSVFAHLSEAKPQNIAVSDVRPSNTSSLFQTTDGSYKIAL